MKEAAAVLVQALAVVPERLVQEQLEEHRQAEQAKEALQAAVPALAKILKAAPSREVPKQAPAEVQPLKVQALEAARQKAARDAEDNPNNTTYTKTTSPPSELADGGLFCGFPIPIRTVKFYNHSAFAFED